jgi:hypothetical protein
MESINIMQLMKLPLWMCQMSLFGGLNTSTVLLYARLCLFLIQLFVDSNLISFCN